MTIYQEFRRTPWPGYLSVMMHVPVASCLNRWCHTQYLVGLTPVCYNCGTLLTDKCPECEAALEYDEVDIGVGVQRGNPRCPECGWVPDDLRLDDDLEEEDEDEDEEDEDEEDEEETEDE